MIIRRPLSRAFVQFHRTLRQPNIHFSRTLATRGSSTSESEPPSHIPLDPITLHRLEAHRRAYYKRRSYYAVTIQKLGEEPEEIPDVVETGTSTIPTFPRVLEFGEQDGEGVEYQLLGLGIRTVSFLGIQVYVVGMYIATDDIASLQESLIRKIDPIASTLVAGEKEKLKELLFDSVKSEEVWGSVLKDTHCRTLIRIVPTRNTDFHHLRDAWTRQITARAQQNKTEFGDDAFGVAMGELKKLFNRGSVPKGKELLLQRGKSGTLSVWYDDGKTGAQRLGAVEDERISRAVWLNYLAGKTVASEGARKSIVEGVMEFVERPVGTVATQVHV
ncbi:hypothetical protein B7494_g2616 [Chlorociboria aeruginascens]|nr:hypothetical protein B7494_g2616 [Chlorociboria aeruginascens]